MPCKEQNWQSHGASRNKLDSYHRPDRIVCKGYGQPSKPQLDLFLQARSMTSIFFFSVFSLSLSHLQTHQVTYLDKFVSLLRSKWTLPPSTFTQDSGAPRLPAIVESRNLRPSWVGQAPVKAAPPPKKGPLETKAKFFPPPKKKHPSFIYLWTSWGKYDEEN